MPYTVLVDDNFHYDNFHYMDSRHRWTLGVFDTLDEALAACRRIVDEDLANLHEPGMSGELFERCARASRGTQQAEG
ncbi:MAG TPA: hypothetical protein VHK26_00055 [Methyloceanibacter sp.]|nr:hypothetical protein [Methyloceanibacter sp.]